MQKVSCPLPSEVRMRIIQFTLLEFTSFHNRKQRVFHSEQEKPNKCHTGDGLLELPASANITLMSRERSQDGAGGY